MKQGSVFAILLATGLLGAGCASHCDSGKHHDHEMMMKHHDGEEGDKDEMGDKKDDETPVKLADLPPAVKDTVTREAGNGKIGDIDKEMKHGTTVYEVDVTIDGKEWELKIGEDGKVIGKKMEEADKEEKDDKGKPDKK